MTNVLTLIGNPAGRGLSAEEVGIASAALAEAGAENAEVDWLAADLAADIPFQGIAPDAAEAAVRRYLRDAPVDVVAQSGGRRAKKLLISDMDSTIIEVECIDELAAYLGLRDQVAAITERAMQGELDFAQSLRARAAMLKGLGAGVLGRAFNDRITYTPGAHKLVRTMRANGANAILVSGGFTYFTERVRMAVGFASDQANELEIVDGVVTGRVRDPILDPGGKAGVLLRLASEHGLDLVDTMAVGDGVNDIPMIQAAGLGIAYHAKPEVAAAAKARIDHGDLTALLYAQGYRSDEFVG